MTSVIRSVQPRRWTTLALATTTVALSATMGHAGTPTMLATPTPTVWLAQAEGGEGGESGHVMDHSIEADDAGYLAAIGLIEGHLTSGLALYRAGENDLAITHMKHPKDEIYTSLAPMIEAHGVAGFEQPLTALATAVEAGAPLEDVEALFADLMKATAIAADIGATDRAKLDAFVILARTAANEYAVGVVDGKVADLHEYQDAWGFLQIVTARATALADDHEEAVAKAANATLEAVAETDAAFGGITATEAMTAGPDALFGAAARIELAALSVK